MNKREEIVQKLEKVGFPANDMLSGLKFLYLQEQVESFGIPKEQAQKVLLKAFHNDGKAKSKNFIEIFRQSDINGSYFNFKDKMKSLEKEGASFGFNAQVFVKTATDEPSLFFINPSAVVAKVDAIQNAYGAKGFTGRDFFKICCKFPSLFASDANSIKDKIEYLHDFFASYGIEWDALFTGIKKQTRLLSTDPKRVVHHAQILLKDHHEGFWSINADGNKETDKEVLTALLVNRPMSLNLADENLKLRRLYSLVEGKKKRGGLKLGTYLRDKKTLLPILEQAFIARGHVALWNGLKQSILSTAKQKE